MGDLLEETELSLIEFEQELNDVLKELEENERVELLILVSSSVLQDD